MLYTGRGDDGTTKTFGCDQRISKSSAIAEALGALDEVNSFLGLCKVKAKEVAYTVDGKQCAGIVHEVQQNLFIIQAEVAGAGKSIAQEKVTAAEELIAAIEKELPPIRTFFISGGGELAALFDSARTMARRAERRVVAVAETDSLSFGNSLKSSRCEGENVLKAHFHRSENPRRTRSYDEGSSDKGNEAGGLFREFPSKETLAYLNRLSSLLYALARLSNHRAGITEEPPSYA